MSTSVYGFNFSFEKRLNCCKICRVRREEADERGKKKSKETPNVMMGGGGRALKETKKEK